MSEVERLLGLIVGAIDRAAADSVTCRTAKAGERRPWARVQKELGFARTIAQAVRNVDRAEHGASLDDKGTWGPITPAPAPREPLLSVISVSARRATTGLRIVG